MKSQNIYPGTVYRLYEYRLVQACRPKYASSEQRRFFVFFEMALKFGTRLLGAPAKPLKFFFCFSPDIFIWGIWVLRDPDFQRKNNICVIGWEGAHRTRVKFQGLSKRRGHLKFFCANNILLFALLPCNYLVSV